MKESSMTEEEKIPRLIVDHVFERYSRQEPLQSALIPILQDIQSEIGYLPEAALERVSKLTHLSTSHIYGVATFYHQFRLTPKGKHLITICRGTACHVKGSGEVYEFLKDELGITGGNDTSKDGLFTLQQVRCVGACSLAPVMKVDETFYGNLDKAKVRKILAQIRKEEKA